jgi:hypothetical protein
MEREDLLMKRLPLLTSLLGTVALTSGTGLASQPPVDDSPKFKVKPLEPLEPLREEDYARTPHLVVGLSGPMAQKIYSYHAPHQKVDLSYPYAPLSRILATHAEGFSCYRRVPKYGQEQFRCNIAFYPTTEGGEARYVPPYTYGFIPHFTEEKLASLSLTLRTDSEEHLRFLLKEAACPRLNAWEFAGSNLPCAYQVEHDRVTDVYFPDDIFPQGVAVGWGVVPD